MKSESITIKDIAKALNLSFSTVSRALKDSYKISEPIRRKVREYANEHHYKPNLLAQSLRGNKGRSIGLLLPAIPNSFFSEVISGIESVANEKDYKLIITQSLESYDKEVRSLSYLSWHSIDGLIVSVAAETTSFEHFKALQEKGTPVVFFDRIANDINTHSVTTDNRGGAYKATKHLIEQGYRRIAQITSPPALFITTERLAGYKEALQEAGIAFNENYIKYCDHGGMDFNEIQTATEALLAATPAPDAIFTASDRITIGTLTVLHKRKMKIPEDIAVIGFSNFSAPEIFNPPLTTIKQPAFEMGRQAIELLLQLIESKRPIKQFEKRVLSAELIVRESTGKNKRFYTG
ncbi:MAG: LacI family DNA-binding transcriptional regulator [Chitinophagaceae bacterium]|nr:LacI family DNA-binding transcriptional regulator [Chitinophagaceae bacterium]